MLHGRTDLNTLGADIRALRKARGLTLAELAQTLGRSVGWLSQVERDMSEPAINDLRDLAWALDVSISSLFSCHKGWVRIVQWNLQRHKFLLLTYRIFLSQFLMCIQVVAHQWRLQHVQVQIAIS